MKDIANGNQFRKQGKSFVITGTNLFFRHPMTASLFSRFNPGNIYVRIYGKDINASDKKAFFFRFF